MKRLLVIGSNSVHLKNYIEMVEDYFDEILFVTDTIKKSVYFNSIALNFNLGFSAFRSISELKRIFEEFNPSVIHVHQANSYAFISLFAFKNFSVPKVLTAWGSDILINPRKSFLLRSMVQYILKHVDVATSDSRFLADEMKKYCPTVKIILASYGVTCPREIREKENIIYTNRMHEPLYNIDSIIGAFSRFSSLHPTWKLVIGAVGSQTGHLKSLVTKYELDDKVEFIGWVNTSLNHEMYRKSKIYVSIPSSDATSISLLEAITNNCVCFVSNLPANSEHILDGVNGFIELDNAKIDFRRHQSIDQDLLLTVNRHLSERYSKPYNREIFISLYTQLLGNPPRGCGFLK